MKTQQIYVGKMDDKVYPDPEENTFYFTLLSESIGRYLIFLFDSLEQVEMCLAKKPSKFHKDLYETAMNKYKLDVDTQDFSEVPPDAEENIVVWFKEDNGDITTCMGDLIASHTEFKVLKPKNIEDLKIGELFKLKENGKVLLRGAYNREAKKYEYSQYDDISKFGLKAKGTKVITEFEF